MSRSRLRLTMTKELAIIGSEPPAAASSDTLNAIDAFLQEVDGSSPQPADCKPGDFSVADDFPGPSLPARLFDIQA